MQFKVPQNVLIEDKIYYSLNAVQFTILVIGGLASFFVFTAPELPPVISRTIGGLMGFFTFVIAVTSFNGQPTYRFFRHVIAFIVNPRQRVWRKSGAEPELISQRVVVEKQRQAPTRTVSRTEIAALAAVLDSRGTQGAVPNLPQEEKP